MTNELQIGPRTVLRPGDKFRAVGGPTMKINGVKHSVAARGPFVFREYDGKATVLAIDADGGFCTLNLKRLPPHHGVTRSPYKIRCKIGDKSRTSKPRKM